MVGFATIVRKVTGKIDEPKVARQIYDYFRAPSQWRPAYDHDGACSWIGNCIGETGLDVHAVGDHGEAFGFGQDHQGRAENIRKNIGVNVLDYKNLTVDGALKAIDWESAKAIGTRHVCDHIRAAQGIRAKVTVIVHEYEMSKHQDSDIVKRTDAANKWSARALAEGWNKRWETHA